MLILHILHQLGTCGLMDHCEAFCTSCPARLVPGVVSSATVSWQSDMQLVSRPLLNTFSSSAITVLSSLYAAAGGWVGAGGILHAGVGLPVELELALSTAIAHGIWHKSRSLASFVAPWLSAGLCWCCGWVWLLCSWWAAVLHLCFPAHLRATMVGPPGLVMLVKQAGSSNLGRTTIIETGFTRQCC